MIQLTAQNTKGLEKEEQRIEVESLQAIDSAIQRQNVIESESCQQPAQRAQLLIALMLKVQGDTLLQNLRRMVGLIKQGFSDSFIRNPIFLKKLMDHFTHTSRAIQKQQHAQDKEFLMVYLLSVFAEMMRESPKFNFPLTRKFVLDVLAINADLLQDAPKKNDILAILSVLYENFSRHSILKDKIIVGKLKKTILENYALIEELFTVKVFNKALYNLSARGVELTYKDFHKYQVMETVGHFFSTSQLEIFIGQIKAKLGETFKAEVKTSRMPRSPLATSL